MGGSEREQVIAAIKQLGRRVTAADVAAKTGSPLLATVQHLNAVAADCQGTLEVTNDGNIVYKFAPAFETAYLKTGAALLLKQVGEKSFQIGYFVLRTSFGVMLIASVITVTILIVVALLALLSKGSDSGGDGGGDFDIDLSFLADIGRFFVWDINYPRYQTVAIPSAYDADYLAYTRGQYVPKGQKTAKQGQGFILNCYSYLFGDGNPNDDLENRKWQLIAEHIRRNNGVTTAEQLACYTGANPKREADALPVLVRFNGEPHVTDKGDIIYVFPSMQVTAAHQDAVALAQPLPNYLEEKRWEFSQQPAESFVPVAIFAFFNFVGCMWLLGHVSKIAVLHQFNVLIDFLSVYAAFFLFFPIIRYFGLQFINGKTALRNAKRKHNWKHSQQKQPQKKLLAAQQYGVAANPANQDQLVYTTEKDLLDQQFD